MKLPKYVKIGKTVLRLKKDVYGHYKYYRDAGDWSVGYKIKNSKLFSTSLFETLDNKRLVTTTKKMWENDNRGYI